MKALHDMELLRKVFRIAFRIGEDRAERRYAKPPLKSIERYATNEEIDKEASFALETLLRQEAKEIIELTEEMALEPVGTHAHYSPALELIK